MSPRSIRLSVIAAACLAASLSHGGPPVGAGLNGVADWSRTNEFADLAKQSRRFGSPGTPWDESAPVDARGWPTGDAGVVLMCCQLPGADFAGVYRISFECATTPTVEPVASRGTIRNLTRNAATGVVSGEYVNPADGEQIMLAFRNTQSGIRNLRVMRPGATDGQLFMPAFLDHNRRFGALRFMDWTDTNNNETTTWAQRTLPEDATWRWRSGVPYEVCVDACNALDRDMWINVPAKADDDYVRRMARLIRDRLEPGLNVYVEYSNEVWNWSFTQATWNLNQAVAEVAAGNSNLAYDGATDHNFLRWRRHARETVRVGRIFAEEFGPGSLNTRVRPMLAAQVVWTDQYDIGLRWINAVIGTPRDHIYAIAGAPYFNLGEADSRTNLTAAEVLNALDASVTQWNNSITSERLGALTAWWGLRPFTAYEGGPDTFGPNNIAAKRAANYDPRMQEICVRYLRGWYSAGGGLFNWFVSGAGDWNSQYGTWTLTESLDDPNTPKIRALDDVRNGPAPPLTAGTPAPGLIDARRHVQRRDNWASEPHSGFRNTGESLDYLVRAQTAGRFKLRVNAAAWTPAAAVGLAVNRQSQGSLALPSTGDWGNSNFRMSPGYAVVTLPAGLSVLRATWLDAYAFHMREIELTPCACGADFNCDGFVDFFDSDSFNTTFDSGGPGADYNLDGFIDFFDFDDFVTAFDRGC
jgi:hypothetical protein